MINTTDKSSSLFSESHDRARDWLSTRADMILRDQIEIAQTPAPPFLETARGRLLADKLATAGVDAAADDVGNVLALLSANGDASRAVPVIVAAHLDTVFGPETPIAVRRSGRRWVGPGIADNARGLAVTLAVARSLVRSNARPQSPILFAFTVGEEGSGNLRGVKHLLRDGSPWRKAAAFIAIDGSGLRRIVHRAVGSRRFRITVRGPGGHSWADWGRPNPANVIGGLVHRLARLEGPPASRSTVTVARLGGGTSINAIPGSSWLEIDVRSESQEALDALEARTRAELAASLADETSRNAGDLSSELEAIGTRPAGSLPEAHPLLQAATEATHAVGGDPESSASSTDANVPLSLGMPAIAIGGGGESGDAHTVNEWFEDTDGAMGAIRALGILAQVARF